MQGATIVNRDKERPLIMIDCLPQIHTIAIHAGPGFQPNVPGVGILCREDDFLGGAGRYKNSIGQMSNYLGVGYQPWRIGEFRVGGVGGVTDGYRLNNGGFIPMAAGMISMPLSWGEAHLIVIPMISGVTPLTFQFNFTVKYK